MPAVSLPRLLQGDGDEAASHHVNSTPFCQPEGFKSALASFLVPSTCTSFLSSGPRSSKINLEPTSFGAGEATAGLRKASDFLFSIDSGKAWDNIQELLKTPAVLSKHGHDYEYWVSEADDTNNDLRRAKDILLEAIADQAPLPEDQPQTSQE